MRWWHPPAVLGGVVILVILAGIILLSTQDIADYKDEISAQVLSATGRKLVIDGELDLAISFSPSLNYFDRFHDL